MLSPKEASAAASADITYKVLNDYIPPKITLPQTGEYFRYMPKTSEEVDKQVEYDMDEEDFAWLELMNERRAKENLCTISEDLFELAMDRFEKESFFQCESLALDGSKPAAVDEDALCSVCGSGESEPDNSILFCDLCNIAVHQLCYGVPRVPAGPWACRRCTLSPSRAIECCLCPNGADGCAMKPTEDGRWAHVSCALWIPEVGFGCASVREPVNGISRVAAARWKLTCFVCRRRGNGACLQCRRTSCYTAFHVSCAIRAGLCSGLPSGDDEGAAVFCDEHSVPAMSAAEAQRRLNNARKVLTDLQNSGPPLSVPVITSLSLAKIKERVALDKKDPFVSRLHSYWTLKRRSRNGAPLLRSMRYSMTHLARQRLQPPPVTDIITSEKSQRLDSASSDVAEVEMEEMVEQLKSWKRLRHDLEKVRLLLELIRKRERMKNELVKAEMKLNELRLQPLVTVLSRMLDELYRLDCDGVLSAESTKTAKSSLRPASLTVMRDRVMSHHYTTVDDFGEDLVHLLDNVPSISTMLREKALAMIASAKKQVDNAQYDGETGTHRDESGASVTELIRDRNTGTSGSSTSERPRVRPSARPNTNAANSETPTSNPAAGSGRPRGRPKKRPMEPSAFGASPASEHKKSVSAVTTQPVLGDQIKGGNAGNSGRLSGTPPTPAGVNRRTAVLFGNKRRPGRPPKIVSREPAPESAVDSAQSSNAAVSSGQAAPSEVDNSSNVNKTSDDIPIKKKRGRKKKSVAESDIEGGFDLGSRWSERAAAVGVTEWGATAAAAGAKSAESSNKSSAPAKESFRLYRDMYDSDAEASHKTDNDEAASSSSAESSGSSQSDDDDDESSSSSDSDNDLSSGKRGGGNSRHSKSRNITARLSPLDLVWAKCSGFPWYPAQVVDPDANAEGGDGVPVPPAELLKCRQKSNSDMFLVMFFDPNRTCKRLPRNKLDPLGTDPQLDRICLAANNKPNVCSAVKRAYDRAIAHRNSASGADGVTSNPLGSGD